MVFFSFSLKVFFIEENPLWEMTRCGAPIVQGVRLSWTGLLFKMSVKWNYCMCLPATAVTAFQYTILNCSEWTWLPVEVIQESLRKLYHLIGLEKKSALQQKPREISSGVEKAETRSSLYQQLVHCLFHLYNYSLCICMPKRTKGKKTYWQTGKA